MRLVRRSVVQAEVFPRKVKEDALGGVIEDFSGEGKRVEASVSYVANTLSSSGNTVGAAMYGVRHAQSVRLRMAPEAEISAGDGVRMPGEEKAMWRCVQVDEYPNVKVARIERIAGEDA